MASDLEAPAGATGPGDHPGPPDTAGPAQAEVVELLSALLAIDTSNPTHPERPAAEWVAERLGEVGVDAQIIEAAPGRASTVARLDAGVHAIGKKVVEEAAEVWMAAEYQSRDEAAEEISQLLYHLQVLMLATDISPDDVYTHL